MALFPKRVDIDTASVALLTKLFNDSAKDLQGYLITLNGVNISKGSIATVKQQIRQRLSKLGVDVGKWVSTTVPKSYVQGMVDSARQHESFGATASATTIYALVSKVAPAAKIAIPSEVSEAAKVISPEQKMFDLHTQSMQTIMDGMSTSFGQSLATMSRSADKVVNSVQSLNIRAAIARQASEDADVSKIADRISEMLDDNDIAALIDAGGKTWSPDVYAEMLARTKLVEARNNGMMNAQQSIGEDLVEVSQHGALDVCGDWEGEILSISGNDPNYSSVDDSISDGLFHPNAVLSGTTFTPYGELKEMIGADYEGSAVVIGTAKGNSLTIGPNHPVLTQRGLVKASLLTEFDYLVYDTRINPSQSVGDSYFKNMPLVEDAFETLLLANGSVAEVATPSHDFHGDIIFCKGEVKVIIPTSRLLPVLDSGLIEKFRNRGFMRSNAKAAILASDSTRSFNLGAVNLPSSSGVCGTLSSHYILTHISSLHNIRFKGKAFDAQTTTSLYNSDGFVVSNCEHSLNAVDSSDFPSTESGDIPDGT
jgi:hypothetical protein